MTDDRFDPEENPPVTTPCRRWIAPPPPDYVTPEEIEAFAEEHARRFQCGKYAKKKPKPEATTQPAASSGEGQFGDEPPGAP